MCRDRAAKTQVFDESSRSQEGVGQPTPARSSASGSHDLVTRCVWWLPDQGFTLSQHHIVVASGRPGPQAARAQFGDDYDDGMEDDADA